MEYTEGEWRAYKDDFANYAYAVDIKHTGREKQYTEIAYVLNKADAHLIAASKDMYEALKALLVAYDVTRGKTSVLRLNDSISDYSAWQIALDAIAKAEGKGGKHQ